jgi:chemotaxis protein MotA
VKAITAIGIGGAFACLLLAVMMEGGNPAALLNLPALVISVAGTGMATIASTNMEQIKRIPMLYRKAVDGSDLDSSAAIGQMVRLADRARRDGLLALEDDLQELDDEFTKKGMQLVVDGTDSDLVRAILQSELDGMAQRHHANAQVFATAGGFAPTLGIIGTVLSLVHVLENLDSPATLGHSIAGAFLATLYGVGTANLLYIPVANKLKELSSEEMAYREMQLEAILSIQAGDNPRMIAEKLSTFVAPGARAGYEKPASARSLEEEEQVEEEREAA